MFDGELFFESAFFECLHQAMILSQGTLSDLGVASLAHERLIRSNDFELGASGCADWLNWSD